MRRLLKLTMTLIVLMSFGYGQTIIAHYVKGKVFTASGFTLEGENLRLSTESLTLEVAGQDQVIPIDNVIQVMAKKGLGKKYGKTCGIMSLALSGLSIMTPNNGDDDGDQSEEKDDPLSAVVGAVMLGGISYGIGYVAGLATDDWEVVYLKRQ